MAERGQEECSRPQEAEEHQQQQQQQTPTPLAHEQHQQQVILSPDQVQETYRLLMRMSNELELQQTRDEQDMKWLKNPEQQRLLHEGYLQLLKEWVKDPLQQQQFIQRLEKIDQLLRDPQWREQRKQKIRQRRHQLWVEQREQEYYEELRQQQAFLHRDVPDDDLEWDGVIRNMNDFILYQESEHPRYYTGGDQQTPSPRAPKKPKRVRRQRPYDKPKACRSVNFPLPETMTPPADSTTLEPPKNEVAEKLF